jgi:hypothetical protein
VAVAQIDLFGAFLRCHRGPLGRPIGIPGLVTGQVLADGGACW